MTTKSATDTGWVVARETFLFFHNSRPPVYRTWIDRDRRTGELVERPLIPLADAETIQPGYEPIDAGTEGDVYTVVKGEKYPSDFVPAVERPAQFLPCSPP